MIQSKKVFIASDVFVAFIDRMHKKHFHAVAFFRLFAQEHYQLYTNILSINEAYTILYLDISPSVARDFLRALEISSFNIIYSDSADLKMTLKTLTMDRSVELTFAKALMAVMCNKYNIPQIATFEYLHALFGLQTFYLPV